MRRYRVPWRNFVLLDINPVVRLLILSDFFWMGAVGFVTPIFALFVEDTVVGGNAIIIGTAAFIYLVTKSLVQIFAASVIDWIRGEKDDFWILFIASFAAAALPLAYLIMKTPMHLFIIQFLYGLLIAFTFPSFMAIFSHHLDHNKVGTEWGVYFTLNDLSAACTAFIGGVIATLIGFRELIIVSVIISILGVMFLYPVRYLLLKK